MEVNVDSLTILPLTIKTPIIEVEADYGSPITDGFMIVFVLAIVFGFRRLIKKYG